MEFNEYQKQAFTFAIYPNKETDIIYPTLGLNGEAGEIAEKVKKIIRDDNGVVNGDKKIQLLMEIGDCIWYCGALCTALGLDMNKVAEMNIIKLTNRQKNNKIHGSGDLR